MAGDLLRGWGHGFTNAMNVGENATGHIADESVIKTTTQC